MENEILYKKRKDRSRRIVFTAVVLLTFFVQNTQHLFPHPWGIPAMLLVPLVVCIGMFERESWGLFYGLLAGALLDAFSTQTVCYHSIMLAAIGFASGLLVTRLIRNNLKSCFFLNICFLFVYISFYCALYYVSPSKSEADYVYFDAYLAAVIYSSFFVALFYFIVRAIVKKWRVD